MSTDNFKAQHAVQGIKGMETIEDDYIVEMLMTHITPLPDVFSQYRKSIQNQGI